MNVVPTNFVSNNHKRYENGAWTGKNNLGAYRGFLFEFVGNANNIEIYNVSLHILDESKSNFGDNIQMSPKLMCKYLIIGNQILMRGWERARIQDEFGNVRIEDFSDYGVELNFENGELNNVTLKLFDREVDINYFNE